MCNGQVACEILPNSYRYSGAGVRENVRETNQKETLCN